MTLNSDKKAGIVKISYAMAWALAICFLSLDIKAQIPDDSQDTNLLTTTYIEPASLGDETKVRGFGAEMSYDDGRLIIEAGDDASAYIYRRLAPTDYQFDVELSAPSPGPGGYRALVGIKGTRAAVARGNELFIYEQQDSGEWARIHEGTLGNPTDRARTMFFSYNTVYIGSDRFVEIDQGQWRKLRSWGGATESLVWADTEQVINKRGEIYRINNEVILNPDWELTDKRIEVDGTDLTGFAHGEGMVTWMTRTNPSRLYIADIESGTGTIEPIVRGSDLRGDSGTTAASRRWIAHGLPNNSSLELNGSVGAVSIYERTASGEWRRLPIAYALNLEERNASFGITLQIAGNTVLASAPGLNRVYIIDLDDASIVNRHPVIEEGHLRTLTLPPAVPHEFTISVSDPDDDDIRWSFSSLGEAWDDLETLEETNQALRLRYTPPDSGSQTSERFTIRATDPSGAKAEIEIDLTVGRLKPPTLSSSHLKVTLDEDTPESLLPLPELDATDSYGAPLTWELIGQQNLGQATLTVEENTPSVRYRPHANANGTDRMSLLVKNQTTMAAPSTGKIHEWRPAEFAPGRGSSELQIIRIGADSGIQPLRIGDRILFLIYSNTGDLIFNRPLEAITTDQTAAKALLEKIQPIWRDQADIPEEIVKDIISLVASDGAVTFEANLEIEISLTPHNDTPMLPSPIKLVGPAIAGTALSHFTGEWQDLETPSNELIYHYQWMVSDQSSGNGATKIDGAEGPALYLSEDKIGRFVALEISAKDRVEPGNKGEALIGSAISQFVGVTESSQPRDLSATIPSRDIHLGREPWPSSSAEIFPPKDPRIDAFMNRVVTNVEPVRIRLALEDNWLSIGRIVEYDENNRQRDFTLYEFATNAEEKRVPIGFEGTGSSLGWGLSADSRQLLLQHTEWFHEGDQERRATFISMVETASGNILYQFEIDRTRDRVFFRFDDHFLLRNPFTFSTNGTATFVLIRTTSNPDYAVLEFRSWETGEILKTILAEEGTFIHGDWYSTENENLYIYPSTADPSLIVLNLETGESVTRFQPVRKERDRLPTTEITRVNVADNGLLLSWRESDGIEERKIIAYHPDAPGDVEGLVWNDANQNGKLDLALIQSDNPHIVYTLDVSGSTADPFRGTAVGDPNRDGSSNTILDAEIAAFIRFHENLLAFGLGNTAMVSVMVFAENAGTYTPDGLATNGPKIFAANADEDGDQVPDVIASLRRIRQGSGDIGGGTAFNPPLALARRVFAEAGTQIGQGNIIFLSDGEAGRDFTETVETLRSLEVNLKAIGVGLDSSMSVLREIDPEAPQVSSTDDLISIFEPTETLLGGVEVFADLNGNGTLDPNEPTTTTTTDNPFSPENEAGYYHLPNLPAERLIVQPNSMDWTPTVPTELELIPVIRNRHLLAVRSTNTSTPEPTPEPQPEPTPDPEPEPEPEPVPPPPTTPPIPSVPPTISLNPGSLTVPFGQAASLFVLAAGPEPLSYQWQKDGAAIPGANESILILPSLSAADQGQYTVVVSNNGGSITSTAATLTVTGIPEPANVAIDPESIKIVTIGSKRFFTFNANGAAGESYQAFQKENLPGASWTPVGDAETADQDGVTFVIEIPKEGHAFFKIEPSP